MTKKDRIKKFSDKTHTIDIKYPETSICTYIFPPFVEQLNVIYVLYELNIFFM